MDVAVFRPQVQTPQGGDRHLKDAAVPMMDAVAVVFVMLVLAVCRMAGWAGFEAGELIEKPGETGCALVEDERLMAEAAFNRRPFTVVGNGDAGGDPNRPVEAAVTSERLVQGRV